MHKEWADYYTVLVIVSALVALIQIVGSCCGTTTG